MARKRKSQIDLTTIFFGVMAAASIVVVAIGSQSESAKLQRRARLDAIQDRTQNEAAQRKRAAEVKVANARYESACVMPHYYVGIEPTWYPKAIAIAEDQPVLSGKTQSPIAEGAIVCDDRGMTGVIRNGVLTENASTDSADLINQRFADALGWHSKAQRSEVSIGQIYVRN